MIHKSFIRPNDINDNYAKPALVKEKFGWSARVNFEDLIVRLCEEALKKNNL